MFCWTVYVVIPRCCRYLTGLITPNDTLIRFSLSADVPVQEADKLVLRRARPVSAIVHFIFDPPEEAFTSRIIRRACFARPGPFKTRCIDTSQPTQPSIMAASVAMYHRSFIFAEGIKRFVERAIHQVCIRTCSYRPAHHFTIKTVD